MELQGVMSAVNDESVSPQEGLWQEMYLGTPGIRIAGGTDEILKNIIAERVLATAAGTARRQGSTLPRDPDGSLKK